MSIWAYDYRCFRGFGGHFRCHACALICGALGVSVCVWPFHVWVSSTEQKPHKPQNRPKIPARHTNSPYMAGDRKNTLKIPEKYPENTNFVFFEYSRGYLKGYFGESHVLYVGGYFCTSLAFLFCSWSRGCQWWVYRVGILWGFGVEVPATEHYKNRDLKAGWCFCMVLLCGYWNFVCFTIHKSLLCLRTPRPATEPRDGPTRNFNEQRSKNTPRPEVLDSQNLPQITPKIPKKYPQNTKNAHFGYFFGIVGVFSWSSRISAREVFFRCFSWKFRVGPSRGSVAGRGVLHAV